MRFTRSHVPAADMAPEELVASWQRHSQTTDVFYWLKEIGFYRKNIVRDPNCLFRAASDMIFSSQLMYGTVRQQCRLFLQQSNKDTLKIKRNISIEEHAKRLSDENALGTLDDVILISHCFKYDLVVIDAHKGPNVDAVNNYGRTIYLLFQPNIQHFDILLPANYMKVYAFCQSITYTLLYEGVFSMTDVEFASNHMLSDRTVQDIANADSERLNSPRGSFGVCFNLGHEIDLKNDPKRDLSKVSLGSNVSNISAKELLKNNIMPFPYKVARGLSPYIYKNIDFDIWLEIKREKDSEGIRLQVGVKCLCKLQPDQPIPYVCYIQSIKPDGSCLVYVEELGEKKIVRSEQLQSLPLDEARPWYSSKKGKSIKKVYPKHKKVQNEELESVKSIQNSKNNKTFFKSRVYNNKVIPDKDAKDSNNNSLYSENESALTSSCSVVESDEKYGSKQNYFQKYTKMDHHSFTPYSVNFIAMPFTVEQNGNSLNGNSNRESPGQSRTPVPNTFSSVSSTANTVQYSSAGLVTSNSDVNTTSVQYSNSPPTPNSSLLIQSSNSYTSAYQPMPIYCVPSVPIPSVRQNNHLNMGYSVPRPTYVPFGVNFGVQRSVNQNGTDLPYNDVTTLRFFFNLGVDWMQMNGMNWPPPMIPPSVGVGAPPTNYYYPPPTTANQLALDMQNNLTIHDGPGNGCMSQDSKNYNNNSSYQKTNNGKYNDYKNKGPHNSRFRKNDFSTDRNNTKNLTNYNRTNVAYNNNNNNPNNKKNNIRNGSYNEGPSPALSDKKDHAQELDVNSPSTTPNFPFTSYPPPMYRLPYYPMDGPENGMLPSGYAHNYLPYGSSPEDGPSPPLIDSYAPPPGPMPPHYMTYLTPPPPIYYSSSSNVPGYYPPNHFNGSQPPNDSPPK